MNFDHLQLKTSQLKRKYKYFKDTVMNQQTQIQEIHEIVSKTNKFVENVKKENEHLKQTIVNLEKELIEAQKEKEKLLQKILLLSGCNLNEEEAQNWLTPYDPSYTQALQTQVQLTQPQQNDNNATTYHNIGSQDSNRSKAESPTTEDNKFLGTPDSVDARICNKDAEYEQNAASQESEEVYNSDEHISEDLSGIRCQTPHPSRKQVRIVRMMDIEQDESE